MNRQSNQFLEGVLIYGPSVILRTCDSENTEYLQPAGFKSCDFNLGSWDAIWVSQRFSLRIM